MDKKATRPPRLEEEQEGWSSVPASPHGNNTLKAQPQAQDSLQPLDYFDMGERTMSPPPVALEKARSPSPGPCPDTPAASTISGISRSSTNNSFQSHDSDITLYSQTTSSSDDTISVPRSLSFPVMGASPLDHNSLPKGANIRVFRLPKPVFDAYTGVPVSMNWASPAPIEGHPPWQEGQGEEILSHNSPVLPSRHQTFPIGRPRIDDTQTPVPQGAQDLTETDASSTSDQLSKAEANPAPSMGHNVIRQEFPPDEADLQSLPAQTDMFLKGRFSTADRWVVGSFDRKHTGLYCGFASSSSTESFLHYRRRFSPYRTYIRAERTMGGPIADPPIDFYATPGPDNPRGIQLQKQADGMRGSLSSSSSAKMKSSLEEHPYVDKAQLSKIEGN